MKLNMSTVSKTLIEELILFLIGGCTYYIIEVLYRGNSYLSMFTLGGLCFVLIGLINELFTWEDSLLKQGIIGAIIVTTLEYITGYILNIKLGLHIWEYSNLPFNLNGQICLIFSLAWFALSIVGVILDDYIRYFLFKEEKPHYKLI